MVTTLVNPRPQAVRLTLSDGTDRLLHAWGLAVLPESGADGHPLRVVRTEYVGDAEAQREPTPLNRASRNRASRPSRRAA